VFRRDRQWLAVSAQVGLHRDYMTDLAMVEHRHPSDLLLLRRCSHDSFNVSERCDGNLNVYLYPHILQVSAASGSQSLSHNRNLCRCYK